LALVAGRVVVEVVGGTVVVVEEVVEDSGGAVMWEEGPEEWNASNAPIPTASATKQAMMIRARQRWSDDPGRW